MPSQLSIADVMEAAGATRADVLRLLTQGGTTEADWAIAHAVQELGGRSAFELMRTAGHDLVVARIWADSRAPEVEAPVAAAVYDPEVSVYAEAVHSTLTEASEQADADTEAATEAEQAAEEMIAAVYADLAQVLNDNAAADQVVANWTHPAQGRRALMAVVRSAPRLRRAARRYAQRPALTA